MRAAVGAIGFVPGLLLLACSSFSPTDGPPEDDEAGMTDQTAPGDERDAAFDLSPERDASAESDAADEDASGGCKGAPACERVVFVSSGVIGGGSINGVTGADTFCTAAASAPTAAARVRARRFRAWASSNGQPANATLVHGTQRYVLANGTVVASDWTGFTQDPHLAPINIDETGAPTSSVEQRVWTGTSDDGSADDNNCGAWSVVGDQGAFGRQTALMSWSQEANTPCSDQLHLYCLEE